MTKYESKRYCIDLIPALQRNRWVAFTQYSDLKDKIDKQLDIQQILETNTDNIKIQQYQSLAASRSHRDYHNYHNYKSFEKNKYKVNQEEKQSINLVAFAGPEQIVYEGSKVFLDGISIPSNKKLIWRQIDGPKVDLKYECKEDEITKIKNPYFKAPYITLDFENNTKYNIKDINNGNKIRPYIKLKFELIAIDQTDILSSIPSTVNIIVKMVQRALIFQGGGALGAYEAGVFKALCDVLAEKDDKIKEKKNRPLFDIIAGSSIGAVNAAIITGIIKRKINDQDNYKINIKKNDTIKNSSSIATTRYGSTTTTDDDDYEEDTVVSQQKDVESIWKDAANDLDRF
jgi:Patatin-like phospholipase